MTSPLFSIFLTIFHFNLNYAIKTPFIATPTYFFGVTSFMGDPKFSSLVTVNDYLSAMYTTFCLINSWVLLNDANEIWSYSRGDGNGGAQGALHPQFF